MLSASATSGAVRNPCPTSRASPLLDLSGQTFPQDFAPGSSTARFCEGRFLGSISRQKPKGALPFYPFEIVHEKRSHFVQKRSRFA